MKDARRFRLLDGPALNVAVFGFLLSFPWEMWQAPLYEGMAQAPHIAALRRCTIAAIGDAAVLVVAFLVTSLLARNRSWILRPRLAQLGFFIGSCLGVTIVLEHIATTFDIPGWTWRYAAAMPVIPLIDVGAAPLVQWIVIPLATAWVVRRRLV